MKTRLRYLIFPLFLLVAACSTEEKDEPVAQPTMLGSWKHAAFVVSGCTNAGDDREDRCTGTAGDCGVLTITESSWTWIQNLPDGSQFKETGGYTLSSNYIILTGDTAPGLGKYSITGSTLNYTTTTLTFVNSSVDTGCVYTVTFSRHLQVGVPLG